MTSSIWQPTVQVEDTQLREDLASTTDALKGAGMVGYDDALGYASDTVGKELQNLAADITGLAQSILEGYASVMNYGAVGDGVADDTAAFVTAMAANDRVFIPNPPVAYRVNTPIAITSSNIKLLGENRFLTKIRAYNTSLPVISISANLENIELNNFHLERSTPASSTGSGIDCAGAVSNVQFHNLVIDGQWHGMFLGDAQRASVEYCQISNNYGNGIQQNSGATGNMVWDILNCYLAYNNGHGISINGVGAATSSILGELANTFCIYNGLYGLNVVGTSTKRFNSIRVTGGAYSFNGSGGIFFDTYSGRHRIAGASANLSGTVATGRQASPIAASALGSGITLSANNNDTNISSCVCQGNSHSGISASSALATITGNSCINNGANTGATTDLRSGIVLTAGKFTCVGNTCSNTTGANSQSHGVYCSGILASTISSNNCNFNTVNGIYLGTVTNVNVTGNSCAQNLVNGIRFASGSASNISNNNLIGNTTNALLNEAASTNSRTIGNLGYQPLPADSPAIGASPWTYTAGNTDETIYWRGGTVSAVTIDGITVQAASSGASIASTYQLGPNESMIMTYTVAPTNFTRKRH